MIINIDTREQKLLDFKYDYVSKIVRKKLNVGDYSACFEDGYEVPVYFERKSIPDAHGTMSGGYKRFKRELMRAKDTNVKLLLIIEGSLTKLLKGPSHATKKVIRNGKEKWIPLTIKEKAKRGRATHKTILTLRFKYGLEHVYCQNREDMSRYIYEYYCKIGELRSKGIEVTL